MSKLQAHLPQATSSSPGQKTALEFVYVDNPPHWTATLPTGYCNESIGQSQFMLILCDALETAGDAGGGARNWKLKGSDAQNHPDPTDDKKLQVTYKFYFVAKN